MAMTEFEKWQKSVVRSTHSREKAKQRRRDIQDLKDAGVWVSPEDLHLNEYGKIKSDAPQWFKNLSKAWASNRATHKVNGSLKSQGFRPNKRKRKKKTMDQKIRMVKIKRSVEMNVLLQESGISVDDDGTINGYDDFTFLPNGRIRTPEKDVISTIQFIHDYV